MYIPYDKIGRIIALGFMRHSIKIIEFFDNLKIDANCRWIKKNKKQVLKRLKKKFNNEPLKVVFYVYENCRWKSQSLYDLMLEDERFEPLIVVTKNCAKENNANFQSIEDIKATYNFFKSKGMRVEYGYDIEKDLFIPLKNFKPDLIFYSHPWYIETSQGPVVCSKFALTYYVPYFVPSTIIYYEYGLRFHQYLHKHYVLNETLKEFYNQVQTRKSSNFVTAGHPQLDYFYLNKKSVEKKAVIYSPHWSVLTNAGARFSTFDWNGEFILEFAKSHPEIEWIFKPHPLLYNHIIHSKYWTKEKLDNYYNEWKSIGEFYDSGDYLDIFNRARAMITDCGSFLTEFFCTEQPVIHLVNDNAVEYNNDVKKIVKSYYQVHDINELQDYLDKVILKKQDNKKEERLALMKSLGLKDNYCAQNILKDIEEELNA